MKKLFLIPLLVGVCLFGSCEQDQAEYETGQLEIVPEDAMFIAEMGYDIDDLIRIEEGYLVEGDILLSEDYLEETRHIISDEPQTRQKWFAGRGALSSQFRTIRVGIGNAFPGTEWTNTIKQAIAIWNAVPSCDINFVWVESGQDLTINSWFANNKTQLCSAVPPLNGRIGGPIGINASWEGMKVWGSTEKLILVTHLLGHSLGLAHTPVTYPPTIVGLEDDLLGDGTQIEGTAASDGNSIMYKNSYLNKLNAQLSNDDKLAVQILYGIPEFRPVYISMASTGNASSKKFTLNGIRPNVTGYSWTVTGGTYEFQSGSTTSSPIIIFKQSKDYTITGKVNYTLNGVTKSESASILYNHTINPNIDDWDISTEDLLIKNQNLRFELFYTGSVSSYDLTWSLSNGGTIVSGQGTTRPTFKFSTTGDHKIILSLKHKTTNAIDKVEKDIKIATGSDLSIGLPVVGNDQVHTIRWRGPLHNGDNMPWTVTHPQGTSYQIRSWDKESVTIKLSSTLPVESLPTFTIKYGGYPETGSLTIADTHPTITPSSISTETGVKITITAKANGSLYQSYRYEWFTNGGNFSSQTNNTATISFSQPGDYQVHCRYFFDGSYSSGWSSIYIHVKQSSGTRPPIDGGGPGEFNPNL